MAMGVVAVMLPTLAHPHPKPTKPTVVYEVTEGDTLRAIAKRFQMSLRVLIDANRLEQPDVLRQELQVASHEGSQPDDEQVP